MNEENYTDEDWAIRESLLRGLAQSARGETHDLGSFIKWADEEQE